MRAVSALIAEIVDLKVRADRTGWRSSMISTHTSARCAADPALVGTRFVAGSLASVVFAVSGSHCSQTSMKHVSRTSLAAFLILSSSASAGPPFMTDDPEPTDYQHWELYVFSQGTHATGETGGVAP
jgi:hypothetical protein